ncbi:hypothetical protein Bca4012_081930 [Brassica carinata]
MDSTDPLNPYSQVGGYVSFLNSQTFPYERSPSTLNFGASEIPQFSSQQHEAPAVPEPPPVASKERRYWSPADDEVLICAWLNTSKDAVVGCDQKSGTFWQRVGEYYGSSPHAKESGEPREHLNCKQRWHKINDYTNKFCAAYAAAERQISSGEGEHDVLKAAHDIYFANNKRSFNLEHAWCVLRFEQKWLSLNTSKPSGSGKRKGGESCSQASSTTVGDHEIRPEGIKAAKAKRNNASEKSLSDWTSVMELKKEDLIRKERLSKLTILDTLLAKKEPLTEAEDVVKNKLLAMMF